MLKQIFYAWRSVIHTPRQSLIKVVSLSFGIGIAVLLFACVAYFKSYDTCYRDSDRLYQLWMTWVLGDKVIPPSTTIIGKLGEGVYEEMPDVVESVTTMRPVRDVKVGKDGKFLTMRGTVADSLFFETMGVDVLSGNPRIDLQRKDVAFISDKIADTYYGGTDPIGKELVYDSDFRVRIAGVFKTIPENSSVNPDIVVSLPTWLSKGWVYSWHGGDSWKGYVRIKEGVDISYEEFDRRIDEIIQRHAPDKDGNGIRGHARLMRETFQNAEGNRSMVILLGMLAMGLLIITALNYVLVSIASLSRRAKAVGVHKCSGAQSNDVLRMFVYETMIVVAGALVLIVLLILQFHDFIEATLKTPIASLFAPERLYVAVAVVAAVFAIGAFVPGIIMSRISVATVFRRFTENRNRWKRVLLFVQFAGVSFIVGFLSVVWAQYNYMVNKDVGYDDSGLVLAPYQNDYDLDVYMATLASMPYVEGCVISGSTPVYSYSGSMVRDNMGRSLFSSRFDCIDKNYFDFMGFKLLAGSKKIEGKSAMIVNREFCKLMGWSVDDAVGKMVPSSIMDNVKVVGVMEDVNIDSFFSEPMPLMLYSAEAWVNNASLVTLRLKAPYEENFTKLMADFSRMFPNSANEPKSVAEIKLHKYADVGIMRNIALIACVSIFFIAFMGLVGYVADEIQRRSKEIAIRKVNGAGAGAIVRMLISGMVKIALPAVVIGGVAAWWTGTLFMKLFPVSAGGEWMIYVVTSLAIMAIIIVAVILMTWRAANAKPTENLRNE